MRRFCFALLTTLILSSLAYAQYFPKDSLDSGGNEFKSQWYSRQLTALEEPSLFEMKKSLPSESYRFLWLRTFHHPVAIRLDPQPDGTSVLTTKVANGAGGYSPGVLIVNTSRTLSKGQTVAFLSQVDKLRFWSARNPVKDQGGTDGSQWILEGVKAGRYHVVDRWMPKAGVARELGWMLAFQLASLNVPADERY